MNDFEWIIRPYCEHCQTAFNEPLLICPHCGNVVKVPPIKVSNSFERKISSMWSFSAFLPKFRDIVSIIEGNTPLFSMKNDAELKGLMVKLECRNPTGTFRDRAASVIVSYTKSKGYKTIASVSTGAFSISIAAYSAHAGIRTITFLPQNLELSKIEQLKIYGSDVIEKGETLEETLEHCKKAVNQSTTYVVSPESNILMIEGQKTIGLELVLQKSDVEALIIPTGSGSLIYSIYRGFEDAIASGLIKSMPVFYAVSLKRTYSSHLAESLDVKKAFLKTEVEKILEKTNGQEIIVDANTMIEESMKLARTEGIFVEPASASVLAAARELVNNKVINTEKTVAVLTGTGINAMNVFALRLRGQKKVVWGLSSSSTTKFEIMNLIAEGKATYGYSIWAALGKNQSLQSIYQHLNELQEKGFIVSIKQSDKKKYYQLTKKGIEALEKMRDIIDYL